MTLRNKIAETIRDVAASAVEIAEATKADPAEVQATLIEMDDAGDVLMRNGWYRLSERAKEQTNDQ